ncbi:VirB4 family type IV secretion system protein [Deinococcus budaensis]|uniref:Conjugal transfer ATP-binding protein TraC n=1 Tax=Deinococcus budaensis TaxID=1665626 RepID=A0A7W8LPY8_9DEIO|nr:hypothetical protein [Deinococcus budaensis]MBB5234199.1 conjugal transfer ATP-binding protein TraC [Deinococcus budaensis]
MSFLTSLRDALTPVRQTSWTEKSPLLGIRQGVHVARNGSAEIGFEFHLPNALQVSNAVRDSIKHTHNILLSQALPVGSRGRIIIENRDMPEKEVRSYMLEAQGQQDILSAVVQADNDLLERDRRAGKLKRTRYYLTVKVNRKTPKNRSLSERELGILTDYCNAYAGRLGDAMHAAGLSPRRMGTQDIANLIYSYRNKQFGDMPGEYRSVVPTGDASVRSLQADDRIQLPSPRRQLTESSVDKSNPGFLVVGTRLVNVVSYSEVGEGTQSGMLEQLLAALRDVEYYLIIDFVIVDPTTKKAALAYKAEGAGNTLAEGGGSANRAISDEMEEALYAITRGKAKMVNFGLAMVIYARTQDELNYATNRARAEMGQLGGALARVGNVDNIRQYEVLEPFNGLTNQYLFDGRTINVAGLIPQVGAWEGTPDPLVVFRNRHGGLTPINQAVGTNNSGTFIIGTAGSGKSNLNMTFLLNVRAIGGKVYILDLKKDYDAVVEAVEGEIIEICPGAVLPNGKPVCINMFDLPPGGITATAEKRGLLMGMFKALLMPSGGLGPLDYTILTSALEAAYDLAVKRIPTGDGKYREEFKEFYLGDFVRILRNLPTVAGVAPNKTMQDAIDILGARLGAFTGKGELASFLNGPTTVRIGSDVTSFNISAMRDESARELRRIGMILLVDLIWRSGLDNPGVIKYPVFEELGAMAEIEEAAKFVAEMFKVGRTFGFYPVGLSQEIGDIENLGGIINNSALRLIGSVTPDEAEKIVTTLKLNEATHASINSLGGGANFREYVAIMELSNGTTVGDVIQNHLTPLKRWLTSSHPADKERREEYTRRLGGNRMSAVLALAGHFVN